MVNPELAALLVVQQDDDTIRDIRARHDALAPRLAAMDKARKRAMDEVARHQAVVVREEDRHRALDLQLAEHRDRLARNMAVLDQAHKVKEATAAMSQVETARRVLADDESELLAVSRRLQDARTGLGAARAVLAEIESDQAEERQVVEAERAAIAAELESALARRAASAAAVGASLLSKYDRVQMRRQAQALFPLGNGFTCGSCDTAIPLQRRPAMSSGRNIEVCEACGVLLYFAPPEPPAAD